MSIVRIRFYLDPESGKPHTHNHDVTEDEVEAVLTKPDEDRRGRDGPRVAIG